MVEPTNAFKAKVVQILEEMKDQYEDSPQKCSISIYREKHLIGKLRPLHRNYTDLELEYLTRWRNANREAFFTWITSTKESSKRWLEDQVLCRKDRVLFLAEDLHGNLAGQIGLTNFDFTTQFCELDNWIKAPDYRGVRGFMIFAIRSLMKWAFLELEAAGLKARVFVNNDLVIKKHRENGLEVVNTVPLARVESADGIHWEEIGEKVQRKANNYYVTLQISRQQYVKRYNIPQGGSK